MVSSQLSVIKTSCELIVMNESKRSAVRRTKTTTVWLLSAACCCLFCHAAVGHQQPNVHQKVPQGLPEAKTNAGLVRGVYKVIPKTGEVVAVFRGIPYAEPPLGHLRFMRTKLLGSWKPDHPRLERRSDGSAIFKAAHFGPACLQPDELLWVSEEANDTDYGPNARWGNRVLRNSRFKTVFRTDEDCLTLNLYSPEVSLTRTRHHHEKHDKKYPVFVFIHGGSYYLNSGCMYSPEKLAAMGLVVITFNYRLGLFGFLSSGDSALPGNAGLWDQRVVLEWVQRNVAAFGGDPNRVTLAGNSAGGASVMLHYLSEGSKALFHRAIPLSGCSTAPWAMQMRPALMFREIAGRTGCEKRGSNRLIVQCLQKMDASDVLKVIPSYDDGLEITLAPVVDGVFLAKKPLDIIRSESFSNGAPILGGLTKDEVTIWFLRSSIMLAESEAKSTENKTVQKGTAQGGPQTSTLTSSQAAMLSASEVMEFAKNYVRRDRRVWTELPPANAAAIVHAITAFYDTGSETSLEEKMRVAANSVSDKDLNAPFMSELYTLVGKPTWTKGNIFLFVFSYSSPTDVKKMGMDWIGSYHESELQYLFGEPFLNFNNTLTSKSDVHISMALMTAVANFAATGNPSFNVSAGNNTFLASSWPPLGKPHGKYLNFNLEMTSQEGYISKRVMFWDNFIPLFRGTPLVIRDDGDGDHQRLNDVPHDDDHDDDVGDDGRCPSNNGEWYRSVAFLWTTCVLAIVVLLLLFAACCVFIVYNASSAVDVSRRRSTMPIDDEYSATTNNKAVGQSTTGSRISID